MKDLVALIAGLPRIDGVEGVEENLKAHLEYVTGQRLIGVSVAFDWQEHEEIIRRALEAELEEMAGEPSSEVAAPPMRPMGRFCPTSGSRRCSTSARQATAWRPRLYRSC